MMNLQKCANILISQMFIFQAQMGMKDSMDMKTKKITLKRMKIGKQELKQEKNIIQIIIYLCQRVLYTH